MKSLGIFSIFSIGTLDFVIKSNLNANKCKYNIRNLMNHVLTPSAGLADIPLISRSKQGISFRNAFHIRHESSMTLD